jgi:hypothetical protein
MAVPPRRLLGSKRPKSFPAAAWRCKTTERMHGNRPGKFEISRMQDSLKVVYQIKR